MKRSLLFQLFFWCFLIILSIAVNAQYSSVHNSRVPKQLIKKTKGSFVHKSIKSVQQGDIAYGCEDISGNTFSVPIPAGTPLTDLAAWTPPDLPTCGVRGGDGNYYVVTSGASSVLWQLDPNTGIVTQLGSITGLETGATINGIAYDAFNNTYYICGGIFGINSDLYELDINTFTVTFLITLPDPAGSMIGIAINLSGIGYGYDIVEDSLYTFDPVTGTASSLFSLGLTVNSHGDIDIDQSTGTIYLAAYNNASMTDQLRTIDPNTGNKTLIADWGFDEVSVFAINNDYGPPVGPGPAANPDPANGATGVALNAQLSWTNPAGATSIDVFFGTDPGSMASIYSGTPVTTVDPGALSSSTTYYWRVDETDASGTTTGSVWNFMTMQVLPPGVLIDDHFNDLSGWTIVGPMGLDNWIINNSNYAGGDPPELQFVYAPVFTGDSWIMNNTVISGYSGQNMTLIFKQYESWYTDPYDLEAGITTDGGITWSVIYDHSSNGGNNGPDSITIEFPAVDSMQIGLAFSGYSYNINYWSIDDVVLTVPLPVEMTSFTADVNQGNVNLNWSTATETNNKGFQIQRKLANGNYQDLAFVNGNGTTTQPHTYSYTDSKLANGVYTYRIKQIDFNGSFEYSKEVKANVNVPAAYSLKQNYPNPFNPTTKINFSLATDSKVTVKVFDVLGREVITLLNSNLSAGEHSINFNAINLESGVYFYRLEAQGNNGRNFIAVKKMILMK